MKNAGRNDEKLLRRSSTLWPVCSDSLCLICVVNQGLVGLRSTRVLDGYQIASAADSVRSRMRPSLLGLGSHAGPVSVARSTSSDWTWDSGIQVSGNAVLRSLESRGRKSVYGKCLRNAL